MRSRRSWSFLLPLGLWMMAIQGVSAAEMNCGELPTDGSPLSYKLRQPGPRCEGMYVSPVSGELGMSLVSFTIGTVRYDLDRDRELVFHLLESPAVTQLRAVGIPLRRYYRLDAELPSGGSELRVPLNDVLKPAQITADELGVFGLRNMGHGQVGYVPVEVIVAGRESNQGLRAIVRSGADVTDVAWRIYAPGLAPTDWQILEDGIVPQGAKLEIPLGIRLPKDQITLEISSYNQGVPRADQFMILAH